MKLFRDAWDDIRRGENIDLYVAAPLAIVIAFLGIFNISSPQLISSITLVILGLLATSLLASRHAVKELSEKLNKTSDTFFFKDLAESDYEADFDKATDLWLVGVSLVATIRLHYSCIAKKLGAGHQIRVLMVDPDSAAVEMTENRNYARRTLQRARDEIRNTLQDLCGLSQLGPGKLEIRTIEHPLGHGVIAIDPETASGALYIQNYPYMTEGGSLPKFILHAKNGFWYDFYKTEMKNLWKNGKPWPCVSKDN